MPLHVERHDRVALLTLNDQKRRNAFTAGMVDEMVTAIEELEADDGVGAVVVTGAPPAFCSGADTSSFHQLNETDDAGPEAGRQGSLRSIYDGFLCVHACTLPTVAAVNGPAVGAGFNLALACDVRLAAPAARFDARFARLGIHPGGGHTRLLTDAVGAQAAAAIDLFGESVDGRRAVTLGLAWDCVDADTLTNEAIALAQRAAETPRELAAKIKATLREAPGLDSLDDAVSLELERQSWSFEQGWLK